MKTRLTPDGVRYLRMARGERQPVPFHLRPLLPWLLRDRPWAWRIVTWASIAACALLIGELAAQHGAGAGAAAVAALLWLGLPSTRFMAAAPVLVDAPTLACALGSAVLYPAQPELACMVAVLAGAVSEKGPILAALFAWSHWPLLGLVVPGLLRIAVTPGAIDPGDQLAFTLQHPLRTGLRAHEGHWRRATSMVLPWGACLAALLDPRAWWVVPVLVAYAQLLVATDTTRLYQMAAPVVCIAAALVIPPQMAVVVLVAHWMNPWAGEGV